MMSFPRASRTRTSTRLSTIINGHPVTRNDYENKVTESYSSPDPTSYLERIRQKREQNEKRLNELGLGEIKKDLKNRNNNNNEAKTPTRRKQKSSSAPPEGERRRSARQSNKPALYSGEEIELSKARFRLGEESASEKKRRKRTSINLSKGINQEQRNLYKNIPGNEWTDDMTYFMREIMHKSESNIERTIRVVKRLASGMGVQHPHTGAFFKKDEIINLSDDFVTMYHEASEWVDENGGDRGNGWLIQHPINKIIEYQNARAERGTSFYQE